MSKRKMKDSGVEWLGEIPAEWDLVPARNLFSEVKDKNIDGKVTRQFSFRYGKIVDKDKSGRSDVTTDETITAYRIVTPDTIMINGLNLNYDFISQRVAIVEERGIITSAYLALCPNKKLIEPAFAVYLFKGYDSKQVFHGHGSGIRKTLNYSDFKEIKTVCPDLSTQRKIAAYLDVRCAKIDEMISDAKKTIEEYKAWKSSVIFEAVTGKNIIGKKKSSGVEWMGDIPASWSLTPLKYLISDYKAGPFGSSLITANLLPAGEILVYTPEHIAKRGTSLENNLYLPVSRREEMSQFIVRPGDVIFPIVGSLGRAMLLGPNNPMGIINQRLAKFRLNPKVVDDRYFMRLFGESDFYGQHLEVCCRGTIIVNLTKSIVGAMPFPLPPLGVQREIAHQLDAQCLVIERVIAEKEKMIADLESYKKSLIFECVTGKMEVA